MNLQKFTIGTKIRELLLANEDINNIVKNKIFPLIAPQNTLGDYIVYLRDRYSKAYTKFGVYEETCIIYLTVVCDDYDNSQQLAILINDVLESYREGGLLIRMSDSTEDYSDEKFIQVLEFTISEI